jgi:SAM-dependent methyltransferase
MTVAQAIPQQSTSFPAPVQRQPEGTSFAPAYACPDCKVPLQALCCPACHFQFPAVHGVPRLLTRAPRFERSAASIATSYDAIYTTQTNVWEPQGRTREFLDFFARLLDGFSAARSLEIGCGEGFLLAARSGGEMYGVDLSVEAILRAQTRANAHFSLALAERLPFPDGHFDLVSSVGVMEHFLDTGEALREIRRILKPGGHYVSLTHVDLTLAEKSRWLASRYLMPVPRPVALTRMLAGRLRERLRRRHPRQAVQNRYTTHGARSWLAECGFDVEAVMHTRNRPELPLVGPSVVIYAASRH